MEAVDLKTITEPLLTNVANPKGGFRTMPFIIVNEAFEKVASYGLLANMVIYLMREYGMSTTTATNLLFFWMASTNFLPILGAVVADSYLGRYRVIGFGCFASLLGMTLLWLTALLPQARPTIPCNQAHTTTCQPPTLPQLSLLYSSFALMSIGAGGIRSSCLAFGADQLTLNSSDATDSGQNVGLLEKFFSLYYVSAAVAVSVALTCVVYVEENFGWRIGFAIPVMFMLASTSAFFMASSMYVKKKPKTNVLVGLVQVVTASYRNRHMIVQSPQSEDIIFHHNKGSKFEVPSEKLRFLNKACMVTNTDRDITQEGNASNPWKLSTVDQVEDLKALINVIPIWFAGVIMAINFSQITFPTLQAASMDRHITPNFEVPIGSFSIFLVVSLTLWFVCYDPVFLPIASAIMQKPVHLSVKQRMGTGIVISGMSMSVAAIVESFRRKVAIDEGFYNNQRGVVSMSAMWLVPQYCLSGVAEALNIIAQNQFYYSELPRSMSSIAATVTGVGFSAGNMAASFLLTSIDGITKRSGDQESWVSSNINKAHFDYYYGLLGVLSLLNFVYFVWCSKHYGVACELDESVTVLDESDMIRN